MLTGIFYHGESESSGTEPASIYEEDEDTEDDSGTGSQQQSESETSGSSSNNANQSGSTGRNNYTPGRERGSKSSRNRNRGDKSSYPNENGKKSHSRGRKAKNDLDGPNNFQTVVIPLDPHDSGHGSSSHLVPSSTAFVVILSMSVAFVFVRR